MLIFIIILITLLLCLPVIFMGSWQLYIHKINTQKPIGTDKTMVAWGENIPVINGFQFILNAEWPVFYTNLKHRLNALLQIKHSPLTIYFNRHKDTFNYHTELTISDIFFEYPDRKSCAKLHLPNDQSIIINACPDEGWIYVVWDHACFDGTRLYNEILAPFFDLKPYEAPAFFSQYTPFITEARIARVLWKDKSYKQQKPLKIFTNPEQQYCCILNINNQIIKKIKNRYQCTTSEAILALYAYYFFRLTQKSSVKIGLLIACEHPRFRNNYSIICLTIVREKTIEHMIKQIIQQKPSPGSIQGMYQLLTFAQTQTFIKKNVIDCLISPFFFQSRKNFTKQILKFEFMNIPTSMPIYSLYISYKNQINISLTINTPEIDQNELKNLGAEIISYSSLL